jgi:hypothetical protein
LSCSKKPSAEGAHLDELHLSGRQLEAAAQSGGAAGVFVAAGCRRDDVKGHAPGGGHPLRRYLAQSSAEYLYEDVYCGRGQMENLIKLHKTQ